MGLGQQDQGTMPVGHPRVHPHGASPGPSAVHQGCDEGEPPMPSPSRMAVQGAPSSCSRRISFSATRFSVSLLRPLKTVA